MMGIVNGGSLRCELTGEKLWKREVGYCYLADGTDVNRGRRGPGLPALSHAVI